MADPFADIAATNLKMHKAKRRDKQNPSDLDFSPCLFGIRSRIPLAPNPKPLNPESPAAPPSTRTHESDSWGTPSADADSAAAQAFLWVF